MSSTVNQGNPESALQSAKATSSKRSRSAWFTMDVPPTHFPRRSAMDASAFRSIAPFQKRSTLDPSSSSGNVSDV
jgi:hypothetical protein